MPTKPQDPMRIVTGKFRAEDETVVLRVPTRISRALKLKAGRKATLTVGPDNQSFTVTW